MWKYVHVWGLIFPVKRLHFPASFATRYWPVSQFSRSIQWYFQEISLKGTEWAIILFLLLVWSGEVIDGVSAIIMVCEEKMHTRNVEHGIGGILRPWWHYKAIISTLDWLPVHLFYAIYPSVLSHCIQVSVICNMTRSELTCNSQDNISNEIIIVQACNLLI